MMGDLDTRMVTSLSTMGPMLAIVAVAISMGWMTAWIDRRMLARLEGCRRTRSGWLGSLTRGIASLARGPRSGFWPTFIASLSLLPGLLLTSLLVRAIIVHQGTMSASDVGSSTQTTEIQTPQILTPEILTPEILIWWLALLVSASITCRWVMHVGRPSGAPGGRRLLESLTPWFGLWTSLAVLFLGVGLAPATPHPVAAIGLLLAAGMWRRLEGYARPSGAAAITGGAADLLARLASHQVVASLVLAALLLSGLPPQWALSTPQVLASVVGLFFGGVVLTRLGATVLLAAATPHRMRVFAWSRMFPLAVLECVVSFSLATQGLG